MKQEQKQTTWLAQLILQIFHWLQTREFEFTEIQNIVIKFLWGIWLLNPLWSTFEGSKGFSIMATLAREEIWGSFIAGVAVLHIIALVRNNGILRQLATFLGFMFWLFVSIMLVSANPSGTGAVVYPIITLSAAWVYLRVVIQLRRR